jgi:hypothetical protein
MPRQAKPKDNTLLEMAIVGYQSELGRISAKIADIKERLGQRGPGRPKATAATAPTATGTDHAAPPKRRTISKAGRARIAAAQRARWAAQKKQQAEPATPANPKEAEVVGGGVEGDQGSDEEAVGGLPEGQEGWGVGSSRAGTWQAGPVSAQPAEERSYWWQSRNRRWPSLNGPTLTAASVATPILFSEGA